MVRTRFKSCFLDDRALDRAKNQDVHADFVRYFH